MINSCYINGCVFERDGFPEGLYVYQSIMTFGHKALCLDDYMQLLERASQEILHRPLSFDRTEADTLIAGFLRKHSYPVAKPAYVELRCYLSGEVVLLGGDVSPYEEFGLRLIMPSGVDVAYDLPLSECCSSISRAVADAARAEAENRGAKVAVRIDGDGFARSVDEAELFVVEEYTVKTPNLPTSVEGRLVAAAIERAGLRLEVAKMTVGEVEKADEIFYADHRGVTALASFNGRPMMHILAEKIVGFLWK